MSTRELIDAYMLAIQANSDARTAVDLAHLRLEQAWDNLRFATKHLRDDLSANGAVVDVKSGILFVAHDEVTLIETRPIRIV